MCGQMGDGGQKVQTSSYRINKSSGCNVPRIAKADKKPFLTDQCKEIEKNRMGKTRDLFKKIRVPRKHFMQRWAR